MAGMIFDLEIYYEDRDDVDQVRADQRDIAVAERKYGRGTNRMLDEMTVQFLRFIGWQALRRLGRSEMKFEDWDKIVTSCAEPDDDGEVAEADPTNPAP